MISVSSFLDLVLEQAGDRYRFGAEVDPGDPDPTEFDCSELVEWAAGRLEITPRMPDGSWLQYRHVHNNELVATIPEALKTPGALLFRFSSNPLKGSRPSSSHVAISLGDGRTMEARSTAAGVGVFGAAAGRGWTHAGLIPGLSYAAVAGEPSPWAADGVAKVIAAGISDGSRPRAVATRQEVMVMLARALHL